jgi:HSP20 family protein
VQDIPINLFRTADRLTVAAPMPGLLPEDITVEVTPDNHLVLHGALRGIPADIQLYHHPDPKGRKVVEEERELLLDEWTVGSYHREIELPNPVNGELATATYGNGVLVVSLPLAKKVKPVQFNLTTVGISRGERVGSAGHPVKRTSTDKHLKAHQAP